MKNFIGIFFLGLNIFFCGGQYDENVSGNWNIIVATNLDQAGDPHHASEYLTKALEEEDGRPEAEFYLEKIKEREAKAQECIDDMIFNIDTSYLTRYHFRDYFQMGFCYELKKEPEKALESYSKSIELNSKHSQAYLYRGLLYEKHGRLQDAEKDLLAAAGKQEGHLSPLFHLGMFYIRNGRTEEINNIIASLEKTRPIYARILREESGKENER